MPDFDSRKKIIQSCLPPNVRDAFGNRLVSQEFNYDLISEKTENYSGADLRLLAKEALMRPLRMILSQLSLLDTENVQKLIRDSVTTDHALQALSTTKRSCDIAWLKRYKEWGAKHSNI